MPEARPIRFGAGGGRARDLTELQAAARRAEELGYSTFAAADHFMIPFAPLIALQAAADATTSLRLTQLVLAQGFRHPAVLAKELATLDVLSGGRLEIGLGAGWKRSEFEQAGLPFDSAPVRIDQMEETVTVLKGLFADEPLTFTGQHFRIAELRGTPKPVQRPHPPIMIGGGGPKLLAAAARHADIIQVLPGPIGTTSPDPLALTAQAYQDKIALIRDAAGERFGDIELGALLLNVSITEDVGRVLGDLVGRLRAAGADRPTAEDLLASPVVAIGSLEQVCDKLQATRDTLGLSYFASPVDATLESLAPVVERLAGT